jgi:hypothetical protein
MASYPSTVSAPRSKHHSQSSRHLQRSPSPITPISLPAKAKAKVLGTAEDYSEDGTDTDLPTQSGNKRQFTNPSMYHDIAPALAAPFMKADGLVRRGIAVSSHCAHFCGLD